ncbi:MAG TPA: hypothetical protein VEZ70_04705 [Allosphingosinicella sp.]|nr:hypothetical protein [Allosphingosinicella sp.]
MDGGARDDVGRIVAFLSGIGIPVRAETLAGDSFLPGLAIKNGELVYDPERLAWPGDLLHEAGHLAVTDPAFRPTLCDPSDDPGEEMAAIAWSWAAAMEIGLAPSILFHPGGYRGGGPALIENFSNGRDVGVPWLVAWDMTEERHRARRDGTIPYPHMRRWLR